jgi:serpin B
MAMAMCQAGAKGNTEKELAKALHFTLPNERLHPAFRRLAYDIQATPDVKIRIANGLCLAPAGGLVSGEFKSLLQEVYGAELFRAEDAGPVNAWVSRKTEGKIPKIIEMLSPDTACVILNAIYFKGGWPDKFDASLTEVQPFRLGGGKELKAPLMYRFGRTRLKAFEGFQAAELPYKGNGFSMVVLLPTEVDGLSKLEDSLTAENVKTWLDKLDKGYEQDIHLYLPKFKAETSYELVPTFESLGVRDAFQSGNADLSGIGGRPGDIAIARIVHKAFVEVNEEGTEAAAATAVMDVYTSSRDADRPSPPTFRADHPFVFLIRHKPSGAVLFIGRLANPAG